MQPYSSTWPRLSTVNHNILIGRLDSLGFSNDCLAWCTNYFSDRVQCVKSEGLLSGPLTVYGCATGFNSRADSLFCIHQWCCSCCRWFLDPQCPSLDIVLTNLQMSFNVIQHSFRGLQLLLNASKTKCMLFNQSVPFTARRLASLLWTVTDLEYVDNYKYLGVWLDCKLSFQTHIMHLQSKITSRIGFLFHKQSLLHSCCESIPSHNWLSYRSLTSAQCHL